MNHTTTVLIAIAAVATMLLAAGTVAALGSNHSAFAWKHKDYQKKYDKYTTEDKSDGNNINVNKQYVKCIVVGRDDEHGPGGVKTPVSTDEDGHAIGPNSCYAKNTNTNNDGTSVTPPTPPTSTCNPSTIARSPATPTDGTCTAREGTSPDSDFQADCTAAKGTTGGEHGANAICTFPSTPA
jgi:hypothetical protein